jgi:hypothetical protein
MVVFLHFHRLAIAAAEEAGDDGFGAHRHHHIPLK